jgi:DNA-directed RNA polymerase specialized sigma subunit
VSRASGFVRFPDLGPDLALEWAEAAVLTRQSEKLGRAAALKRRAVVDALTAQGLSQRGIAAALGISQQRVQQIAAKAYRHIPAQGIDFP